MNIINFIFTTLIGITADPTSAVTTVPFVDINKYQGQWYEVAAIPQSFQKKCAKNTSAIYTLDKASGYLKVKNSCIESNGKVRIAEGRGRIEDTKTNAKLKVTFVKLVGWIFAFGGNYWILDLEKNYQWVAVGDPTTKYAWILSRKPTLTLQDFQQAQLSFKKNGYDTCQILTSVQDGGLSKRTPLCEYVP